MGNGIDENAVSVISHKVYDTREKRFRKDVCDPRHEEVTAVKEGIEKLEKCMNKKFGWLYSLIILTLLTLVGNLAYAYITQQTLIRMKGGG